MKRFNQSGEEVPFDILMRSIDDVAVVARPSLLNIRNLILLTGLLFMLLARGRCQRLG